MTFHKYKLYSRLDKGDMLDQALQAMGNEHVRNWKRAEFILADHDQKSEMRMMYRDHKSFFIYPHSARSMILWDGILPPVSYVKCNFVFAEGQREVMKRYGYKTATEVMGWIYCPIKPFSPSRELRRVLFAPIHPNGSPDKQGRRLMQEDKELNRRVMNILCQLGLDVTVRIAGNLDDFGLVYSSKVSYQQSNLTIADSLQSMEGYDVLIGHQTYAYLGIASGIPTVMFGEDTRPHSMHIQVRHWDLYKNLLMFPFDLLQGDPRQVLEIAIATDEPIRKWKDNFIGPSFDASKFICKVESYL